MDITSNKKPPHFNIYHYDAQLAIAFQKDCEILLDKFKECKTYNFSTFAEVWKGMNFLHIFKGQEYILMIQTFLDNCFFIIKKFLLSGDFYVQTGAVYTLYSLYYKQPIKEWVKIRLTQTEADKLNEIVSYHKTNNLLDIVFIYNKMRLDEVFQYCALAQPLGLEARFLRRHDLSNKDINLKRSKQNSVDRFRKLMEEDKNLVELEETDQEYQTLSNKYKEKYGNLFIFPSKIGDDFKKAYSEVFNVDLVDDEGEQDQYRETKNRAMSNINAVYRGDKKVVTAIDLDTPSTSKVNLS